MHFTLPRAAGLVVSAFLTISAAVLPYAGELSRPVPPDAQVTRFTRFNIRYSLRDVVADGVQKVEFYITDDMGRTWSLYGEDPDRTSPMTVQVPGEGVYGFVCIATDRFGNREREPGPRSRPETVIVVDRTAPTAKWLAPTQNTLGKGQPVELDWEATDTYFGNAPVKIQFAQNARSNHDREANWQDLATNLSAKGNYRWVPPADTLGRFNFRLIAEDRAGNLAVAYNSATIVIDSQPPVITSVSPLRSNQLRVDILVDADDGPDGSGVKEISLYTTGNNGTSWSLVKETSDTGESVPVKRGSGQPITFEAPQPGVYGLWPVVFDEAGNGSALPPVGTVGPHQLTIDTEPPIVTLSNTFLMGRAAVLASDQRRVEWTAYDPHLQENSAAILLSLDNGATWQELRSFLPTSGSELINFPFGSQSEEAQLKVTVADEFGNVGQGISETFKLSAAETVIDSVTPVGTPPASGADPYGLGGATQPITPTPGIQTQPYPSEPVSSPYPSQPYPGEPIVSPYPEQPDPYGGYTTPQPADPYGAPAADPFGTYTAPTATDPYSTWTGGGTARTAGGYGTGESTAGSLPQAMLGSGQPSGQTAPSAPGQIGSSAGPLYSPPATAPVATDQMPVAPPSDMGGWQPSPSAGIAGSTPPPATPAVPPPAGWAPSAPATSPSMPSTPSLPAAPSLDGQAADPWAMPPLGGSSDLTPPPFGAPSTPGIGGSQDLMPPALPTTPATPSTPAAPAAPGTDSLTPPPFGSDWASGSTFGSDSLQPPSLPSMGSGDSMALPPLELPGFGDQASTPAAPGLSTAPSSLPPPALPTAPGTDLGIGSSSLPPPALPGSPVAPAAPTAPSMPAPLPPPTDVASIAPTTPAAPAPFGTTAPTSPALPQIPAFEDPIAAPPLSTPSATARPVNVRQESDHYVTEAKAYLDEGRPDLGLQSGTQALNADDTNPHAYSVLAQAYVQQDPPNFARAATLAKEATKLGRDWDTWWNCADVFYRWAHARNRTIQAQIRGGQRPPADMLDERNQALNNAQIAIGNSAMLVAQGATETDRKQVAITQGEITYLRALTIPEPVRPGVETGPAADEYRRAFAAYKASVTPVLLEALPYFQAAMNLDGAPSYRETFHLGIINFRLGGLERESNNAAQAAIHYTEAARYLEEATTARAVPAEGPREAYYMLAYCHDQLAEQPSGNRARHKELALRYWRQTAEFYPPGTPYRDYAEQRLAALSAELGQ